MIRIILVIVIIIEQSKISQKPKKFPCPKNSPKAIITLRNWDKH